MATKAELERTNYELREEVNRLREFEVKWRPLVEALQRAVRDEVDEAIVRE